MEKKQRLIGIDLFRGIAVYAVVILHSDEGISTLPTLWSKITHFAGFAVPFFLTASFYLAISKLYNCRDVYLLKSRLVRLFIPYGVWSVIYLLYKIAKYSINNEPENLHSLFQDPLSLIFIGGAAFHLYFLPILIIGTILVKFFEGSIAKKVHLVIIVGLCFLSFIAYETILVSGSSFQLGANVAFEPLLNSVFLSENQNPIFRLILVEISWTIRCLPYILLAMVLNHPSVREGFLKLTNRSLPILLLVFFSLNFFDRFLLPASLYEVFRGYSAFLLGVSISSKLKDNPVITNVGVCSFGIYLIHLLFVEVFQIISHRVAPGSIDRMSTLFFLAVSILSFSIAWLATSILVKKKSISKLLFGA